MRHFLPIQLAIDCQVVSSIITQEALQLSIPRKHSSESMAHKTCVYIPTISHNLGPEIEKTR